jgi:hypothetical protein
MGRSISYDTFTKDIPTEILADGLENHELEKVLRSNGVKFKKHVEFPTVKRIERLLDQGKSVILGYYWVDYVSKREEPYRGHFTFIHGHDKDNMFMENKLHVPSKKYLQYSFDEAFNQGYDTTMMYSFKKKSS